MICDLHTHSRFSFDGSASLEEMSRSAAERGVRILATTDHCDMTGGAEGFQSYLDCEQGRLREYAAVKDLFPDLELLYGLELGNPEYMPEKTEEIMSARHFDFVIGGFHFLSDGSDIYKIDYPDEAFIDWMFEDYFTGMARMAAFGGFDTLAHLDYPLRVLKGKVPTPPSVRKYRDLIEPVLEILVRSDIALEINTRGTYDWQGRVGPEDWVLKRYRELGGRLVTIGSDAHLPRWVGEGFRQAADALRRSGFDSFTVYRDRKPFQIPLDGK